VASVVGARLSELLVGVEVEATVLRVTRFGVFCYVGAEQDALLPTSQMSRQPSEYVIGEKLEGMRITEIDQVLGRLSLSDRLLVSEFSLGQRVSGRVTRTEKHGVYLNIGACVEAYVPKRRLVKKIGLYKKGDLLTELEIVDLDVDKNRITVEQKSSAVAAIEDLIFRDLEEV